MEGLAAGCRSAGCALVGGELAEHPDALAPGDYDIAGFAVGVTERARLRGPITTDAAALVGLASGGLRCNGYSLARRVLLTGTSDDDPLGSPAWPGADHSLGDEMLRPSVIYTPAVLALFDECGAVGAAHITGGGLVANVARMLGPGVDALLWRDSWPVPRVFDRIAEAGPVAPEEMERVFNLGIGMVVAVPVSHAGSAVDAAHAAGHDAWVIGEIRPGTGAAHLVEAGQLAAVQRPIPIPCLPTVRTAPQARQEHR